MRFATPLFRCLAATLAALLASAPVAAECRLEPGPQRTVTRVIDGETLALDDGSEVRLAGALAPSAYDAGADAADWPAAVAARAALAAMAEGRTVVLGYTSNGRRDRLGRHVAQVFVVDGGAEIWLQGRMLSEGHARAYQLKDQRGCAEELLQHERVARAAGRGVWAVGAYLPRSAQRTRDLAGLAGKFAVLTGRVAWVAPGRESIALGFSPSDARAWTRRRGVIVMIDNHDRPLLGALGGDAKALEGREVEVRGWLEQRLGRPGAYVIDVSLAGMIVAPADAAAAVDQPPRRRRPAPPGEDQAQDVTAPAAAASPPPLATAEAPGPAP